MLKSLILFLSIGASGLCSGCIIGAPVLHETETHKGPSTKPFPSLHSVPERPQSIQSPEIFEAEHADIKDRYEDALKRSQGLRDKAAIG